MISRYQTPLISFAFPENWKLTPPDYEQLPQVISVESPEGSLWILHAFPPGNAADSLFDDVLDALKQNYEDFECDAVVTDLTPPPLQAMQADFFCLDFLVTARVMKFVGQRQITLVVVQQAESRQFEKTLPVFDAITTSLVASTK